MAEGKSLHQAGERIERLLDEVRSMASPPAWERVDQLVRAVVELYGAGLEHIMTIVAATDLTTNEVRERLLADPLVASLLLLHGLHPDPLATRVETALARVRPYLGSHGGDVEIVGTDEQTGVVRLRMKGSCDGCPSSLVTVKLAVEGAILELAPEVSRIEVEGLGDVPQVASASESGGERPSDKQADGLIDPPPAWVALGDVGDHLATGGLAGTEVEGARIILCNVEGGLYAYRNGCPSCGSSAMDNGHLDGELLACPSCGHTYDVRLAGRSTAHRELHLDPLPLLADGGAVKIAVPAMS